MSRASAIYVLVNSLALAFERTQSATLLLGLRQHFYSLNPKKGHGFCRVPFLMQKICVEPHAPVGWHITVGCFRVSVHARGKKPRRSAEGTSSSPSAGSSRRTLFAALFRLGFSSSQKSRLLRFLGALLRVSAVCLSLRQKTRRRSAAGFLFARGFARAFATKKPHMHGNGSLCLSGRERPKERETPVPVFPDCVAATAAGGQAGGGFPPVLCRRGRPDGEKR